MRLVFLLALGLGASSAGAQTADTLTIEDGWRNNLVASLQGNQSAHSNWQEGGVDALAFTAITEGSFDRVVGPLLVRQTARLAYGLLQQDTLAVRKATDVIRFGISAELASKKVVRPSASFSLRTQFAPGFDYSPTAEKYPRQEIVPGEELKVSDVLSPLVLSQSVGIAIRLEEGFNARTGLALKETVVEIWRLRPIYGNDLNEAIRTEAGVDGELTLEREVVENVSVRSRLYGFQGFGMIGQEAPDLLFENRVVLKVNSLLNVTLDATALYDADISEDVQFRETLAVGVTFDIL